MGEHANLCEKIRDYLKTLAPDVWWFRPVNTGYSRIGVPDFLVCAHGHFLAFEAKVGRDTVKPWQEKELKAIEAAGGATLVVRELRDVVRIMEHEN